MKVLLTAIYSALMNGTPGTLVDGRIYLDRAPEDAQLPFIVFFIVNSNPDDPFAGTLEHTWFQFNIFSSSSGVTEISDIYDAIRGVLDDSILTLSAGEMVIMKRNNLLTSIEEETTSQGTEHVKHWLVEYEVLATRG